MPRFPQVLSQLSVESETSPDVDDEEYETAVGLRDDENEIEEVAAPLDELPLNPDKEDYQRVRDTPY